jgi:hypothetical protein
MVLVHKLSKLRWLLDTPLMNDLGTVTSIMRTKMEKGKGKASGKEGGNEVVIGSD